MTEVVPAILTDSSDRFKELVRKLEPYTNRVHIDIADGVFVSNKTVTGYEEIKEIESAVKFDVHLMVQRPQDQIKEWFYTHADRFIIHPESEVNLGEIIKNIKENSRKVGLSLNPETPVEKIEPYLPQTSRSKTSGTSRSLASGKVDFVQFMTVHPGFQGQQFLNEAVDKIASFHQKHPDIMVMCDGGITSETARRLVGAGVSALVSGSYIIKSQNVEKAIEQLWEVANPKH